MQIIYRLNITPAEIKIVVLEEDDFGHEMRVAHLLRQLAPIQTWHGGTYTDLVSGKPRQFDFRAQLVKGKMGVFLAIECKNLSTSAPVVVCGTERRENEAYHEIVDSRVGVCKLPGDEIDIGLSHATLRSKSTLYKSGEFVGKSLLRIKKEKNKISPLPDLDIYDRWSQAIASSVDLLEWASRKVKGKEIEHFYSAVFPIVVVPNETLWAALYDSKGDVIGDPVKRDQCELYVGRSLSIGAKPLHKKFHISHIHFFTLNGFASFVSSLVTNNDFWETIFDKDAVEL